MKLRVATRLGASRFDSPKMPCPLVQPPASRVLAANAFTPFGMLAYDDQPAISMQFHPEFEPDYARALIEGRRDFLPDPEAAIASLDAPDDRSRVAAWIRRFLEE